MWDQDQVIRLATVRAMAQSGAARRIREAANVTLTELADAVQVSKATLHRWESGDRLPQGEPALTYLDILDRLATLQEWTEI